MQFLLSWVSPLDDVWLSQMVPRPSTVPNLRCQKWPFLPQMVTLCKEGPSKAVYVLHVKGKIPCSSYVVISFTYS